MRREVSRPNTELRSLAPPDAPLTDGVVTLRLPEPADVARLERYGRRPDGLDGVWIPTPRPGVAVEDWAVSTIEAISAGWTPSGSIEGPAFVIDETEPFAGIVYLAPRGPGVVELSYGVEPGSRCRGVASRAARIAGDWALTGGRFSRVELRIASGHPDRIRVAENAGYRFDQQLLTHVETTGQTYTDLVYVRDA